jgi:hypothetical protein
MRPGDGNETAGCYQARPWPGSRLLACMAEWCVEEFDCKGPQLSCSHGGSRHA